jgi:hypothetical protein
MAYYHRWEPGQNPKSIVGQVCWRNGPSRGSFGCCRQSALEFLVPAAWFGDNSVSRSCNNTQASLYRACEARASRKRQAWSSAVTLLQHFVAHCRSAWTAMHWSGSCHLAVHPVFNASLAYTTISWPTTTHFGYPLTSLPLTFFKELRVVIR